MFGGKKKPKVSAKIESLIGAQTEIRGDIVFSGGLHVDGVVKGNVIAEEGRESVLSLSERGTIEGEVRVANVMLNGTVIGDVYADTHIELAPQAKVSGNVYYSLIEMSMGAEVNGSLIHRTSADKPLLTLAKDEKKRQQAAADAE